MAMEGLLEFTVCGFLNVYTRDFRINGEILGFLIALFCLSSVIFVTVAMVWAIFTKNHT